MVVMKQHIDYNEVDLFWEGNQKRKEVFPHLSMKGDQNIEA